MKYENDNQKGFAHLLVLLVVLVALVVVATAYYVYRSNSSIPTTKSTAEPKLVVKEWGVAIPLTSTIRDAYYTYKNGVVTVSTHKLDSLTAAIPGCRAGLEPVTLLREKPGNTQNGITFSQQELESTGKKIGDWYYIEMPHVSMMCAVQTSDTTRKASAISRELETARKNIEAE